MTRKSALIALFFLLTLTIVSTVIAQDFTTYITAQRFENGLMIWRSDNGTIYALGDEGQEMTFPVTRYASLPDNPIFGITRDALRPILGMGKVWGNNLTVREMLGNALLPEIGFDTNIMIQQNTIFITELDQSVLQINPDGTWVRTYPAFVSPPAQPCPAPLFFDPSTVTSVCPYPPETSSAVYQSFEHGFMVWFGDGDVWVFVNPSPTIMDMARWMHFELSSYYTLPDPARVTPPQGRIQPVSAFGRVWGNLTDWSGRLLRDELGWATSDETNYTATTQLYGMTSHVHQYLSLPDNRVIDAYSGLAGINWIVVS